jgi:hypothetical protein
VFVLDNCSSSENTYEITAVPTSSSALTPTTGHDCKNLTPQNFAPSPYFKASSNRITTQIKLVGDVSDLFLYQTSFVVSATVHV